VVKARLEGRDQRNLGQLLAQQADCLDVRRVVGRRHLAHRFHGLQHVGGRSLYAAVASAVHRLETDGGHFRSPLQTASLGVGQLLQAMANRHCVIRDMSGGLVPPACNLDKARTLGRADSLGAAPGQLTFVGHVEQAVLKARRAEIRHENFHPAGSLPGPSPFGRGPG
jgi:hypothetical protein